MPEWTRPEFDRYRAWIDAARDSEKSWDEILKGGKPDKGLDQWLTAKVEWADWPSLGATPEERAASWRDIVAAKKAWAEEAARHGQVPIVVGIEGTDRAVSIPEEESSTWRLYRKYLLARDWKPEAVDSLQSSSFRILRRLKFKTSQPDGAVKGMVVGHVQSGKTASMAGLIAMAADWGWNVIIVMTGTIENLRKQTEDRLVGDLNHSGNLTLQQIEYPAPKAETASRRSTACHLGADSRQRYLIVTLKNKKRLEDLYGWLTEDVAKLEQMRVLIIDDEADQGGIDTKGTDEEERSKINGLIVDLTRIRAACVNYVAYTATPYANFLNEAYPESLYPQTFIVALPQSPEHFGPRQVFGVDDTDTDGGMGIVCAVPEEDLDLVKALHNRETSNLPDSLKDAVCWFLCAVAAIRTWGDIKKAVSMLVHTSATQSHHAAVASAIAEFLQKTPPESVASRCRTVWEAQTAAVTLARFAAYLPHYGRLSEVRDYPQFDAIASHIPALLSQTTHILMQQADDGSTAPQYHKGTHLCIDNCANNGLTDEGEHLRLRYPTKEELRQLDFAPAFIVVGGSTLSRGLTLENLVSTFFLRAGAQMDTLMQMGRWFGFRPGYELLPRVWMPEGTREKFVYMAGVEAELREELERFMNGGRDPKEYGPRVKVHPKASWLRPTAKNRMQAAESSSYDFSGVNRQTTIFFSAKSEEEANSLRANLAGAESFLASISSPHPDGAGPPDGGSGGTLVWRGVRFELVRDFLRGQKYHPRVRFFNELEPFIAWFEKNAERFKPWNVVAGGISVDADAPAQRRWDIAERSIGKVRRTRLIDASTSDSVSIGTLRDPQHLVVDAGQPMVLPKNASNVEVSAARKTAGLGDTPQLLVYRIDKDSKVEGPSELRSDLDVPEDLIGVSIWLPDPVPDDRRTQFATHVQVRIPDELRALRDDIADDRI